MKYTPAFFLTALLLLAIGCKPRPHDVKIDKTLPAIYPDYVGVTVPFDIAPLNFAMISDKVDWMCVEVTGSKGGKLTSEGEETDFDIDQWHQLLADNQGGQLSVTVTARENDQWKSYRPFTILVGTSPMGEWGVTDHTKGGQSDLQHQNMAYYCKFLTNSNRKVEKLLNRKGAITRLYCQPGGGHCEADWEKEVPDFMDFLWK